MRSSTKVLLVLGGSGAAAGALAWYLWDPAGGAGGPGGAGGGAGAGGGRMGHGIMPWLFRGGSSAGAGPSGGAMTGTTHGGFGTTAHAVSG